MKNEQKATAMEAALEAAGVIEAAEDCVLDVLTASPEEVAAELERLKGAAEAAEAEAVKKGSEAAEAAAAAEAVKAEFKTAADGQKAAFALKYMEAAEAAAAAEKTAAAAAEKADAAAEAAEDFKVAAADVFVVRDFLTALTAEAANAASAAQIALAFHRPDKYLNDKSALQADALQLCRRVLGDAIPDTVSPTGIFFDTLTVKGALTLCALLCTKKALTVKEARARFRVR